MPTPEEIKKIADEYVRLHRISESESYYENKQNIEFDDVFPFLQWLSKDYCIVPKSNVEELYHQIKLELGDGGCSEYQDNINMEKESMLISLFGTQFLRRINY